MRNLVRFPRLGNSHCNYRRFRCAYMNLMHPVKISELYNLESASHRSFCGMAFGMVLVPARGYTNDDKLVVGLYNGIKRSEKYVQSLSFCDVAYNTSLLFDRNPEVLFLKKYRRQAQRTVPELVSRSCS